MISSNFSGLGKWFLLFKKIRWVISVWFILLYLTLLAWSTTKIFMDKSSLWCFKMFQGENIVLKTLWASQKYNFLTLCWHNFYVLEQTLLPFASIIIQSPSARVKILTYLLPVLDQRPKVYGRSRRIKTYGYGNGGQSLGHSYGRRSYL